MHFDLSEERQMLADTASRFIADRYDIKTRHTNAKRDEGFNRDTWAQFADLGLIGALLPPDVGGFAAEGLGCASPRAAHHQSPSMCFATILRWISFEPP